MTEDIKVLRKLANEYHGYCFSDENLEKQMLHMDVNDLRMKRPVVLIDELPWHEMNLDDELTLLCKDGYLRTFEEYLRKNIYMVKHLPCDKVLPPYIPVGKAVSVTGERIGVEEEILDIDPGNNIVSHMYKDILKSEEDLERLKEPVITLDEEETRRRFNMAGEIFADILPVKLTCTGYFSVVTWDDISRYRSVNNLLIDLYDRPEFMHKLARKLTDFRISFLQQAEDLNLLDNINYNLHCTPALCRDLPAVDEGGRVTRKNIWGRGTAQIFGHVSSRMHDEFDIEYMIESIGSCGLSYYGCCEPLDRKMDIVARIPNLRKVSITPWADYNVAAEAIGKKYVFSAKPNPASVAVDRLDEENLRDELSVILNAAYKNNCSCDIVLKDISTCGKRPENIFRWEQIAMEMVNNF